MKVAIGGGVTTAPGSFPRRTNITKAVYFIGPAGGRNKTPWEDDAEFWFVNEISFFLSGEKCNRWFEMHWPAFWRTDEYRTFLQEQKGAAIYMLREHADIPCSIAYPLEEMVAKFGRRYFTNTFCYMLALAISEGFDEIRFYGTPFRDFYEFNSEVACMNYWIGQAEGRDIKVVTEPHSRLVNGSHLYGYEEMILSGEQLDDPERIASTPINAAGGLVRLR